ncbi:MAG: hypothetical protein Q7U78_05195, partial [Gallionella sp.]|nr:hypothetical protein [Gallionella sp.]
MIGHLPNAWRYFDTGRAPHCICVTNRPPATIAAPAVVTTSYTSGGAEYTQAGANSYADTMNNGNEGWVSDSGNPPSTPGGDPL